MDSTKVRAHAVAEIVRTTLQDAQRQAITRQHDMVVSFGTSGESNRSPPATPQRFRGCSGTVVVLDDLRYPMDPAALPPPGMPQCRGILGIISGDSVVVADR